MRVAAFTMCHNEGVFLPIWINHYGNAFGKENLFIIDHTSDDGSTEVSSHVSRLIIPRTEFDEDRRRLLVQAFQMTLLTHYDVVVFTDTDELLVPDPAVFEGLYDYIRKRCHAVVQATGLDVLHIHDIEKAIDLDRDLFVQRKFVQFSARYCKPLISRVPLVWRCGFHSCDVPVDIDPELFLFHLKRMDLSVALKKLDSTRKIVWSPESLEQNHGYQHRYSNEEMIQNMFDITSASIARLSSTNFDFSSDIYRYSKFSSFVGTIAHIPERFSKTIRLNWEPHERIVNPIISKNFIQNLKQNARRVFSSWI